MLLAYSSRKALVRSWGTADAYLAQIWCKRLHAMCPRGRGFEPQRTLHVPARSRHTARAREVAACCPKACFGCCAARACLGFCCKFPDRLSVSVPLSFCLCFHLPLSFSLSLSLSLCPSVSVSVCPLSLSTSVLGPGVEAEGPVPAGRPVHQPPCRPYKVSGWVDGWMASSEGGPSSSRPAAHGEGARQPLRLHSSGTAAAAQQQHNSSTAEGAGQPLRARARQQPNCVCPGHELRDHVTSHVSTPRVT